ncbi:MAG: UDP-N-acetylmuramoyl-L-alanyl-D-glutamate--2,6-diaminopimelate ligase [Opitutales bacterium]
MSFFAPLQNTFCWPRSPLGASLMVQQGGAGSPGGAPLLKPEWTLERLLKGYPVQAFRGEGKVAVRGLMADSRRVMPGMVFFALAGRHSDGNHHIEEAIDRGAVAVVSEQPMPRLRLRAYVQVADARQALALLARRFYREPDELLEVFGVTGTNGKTTVTTLLRYLLDPAATGSCGLIGTVAYQVGGRTIPAFRTTPEAIDTYAMLAEMQRAKATEVAVEISSHGIDQQRVQGLNLRHAAFLNLTQDHIDYHESMETYYQVKRRLFTGELGHKPETVSVNLDDAYGQRLIEELPADPVLWTFGEHADARVRAVDVALGPASSRFGVEVDGLPMGTVESALPGRYNVSNVLAALSLLAASGRSVRAAALQVSAFEAVPGRMEKIDTGQNFTVLVDYAHTDDALRNVLESLRAITPGRVLVVFGCGGDRDRTKRPRMTAVVQALSDHAWATADNPRKEPLEQIFEDMRAGVSEPERLEFVEDRRRAISLALDAAQPTDCVLIAGKGHEAFQELPNTVVPFDDRQVAREVLRAKQLRPPQS